MSVIHSSISKVGAGRRQVTSQPSQWPSSTTPLPFPTSLGAPPPPPPGPRLREFLRGAGAIQARFDQMRLIFSDAETEKQNRLKLTQNTSSLSYVSLTAVIREALESAEQVHLERVLGSAFGLVVVHHHQALSVVLDRRDEPIYGLLLPLSVRTVGQDPVEAAFFGEGRIFRL